MSQDDPMSTSNGDQRPIDPELISAFYDGETTPEERAAVETSMDETSNTLQTLDEFDQLSQCLRELHREVAAPDLRADVMARIQPATLAGAHESLPRRRIVQIVAGLTGLAAAVTLLMWPSAPAPQDNRLAVNETPPTGVTGADEGIERDSVAPLSDVPAPPAPTGEAGAAAPSIASMEAPSTAQMEANITSSLAEMTRERSLPEVGDVMGYLNSNADELTWVSVTVVDVQKAGDQVQLLLARNGVASPATAEADEESGRASGPEPDRDNLMTFVVEADWEQMEAVIVDLSDAEFVDTLEVNAPSDTGVPEVLQGYAIDRNNPALAESSPSALKLKQRVQDRQAPSTTGRSALPAGDGREPSRGAVHLQLLVRDADLKRIAARRGAEPQPSEPAAEVDKPAEATGPGIISQPLASPRFKGVIVIQKQDP